MRSRVFCALAIRRRVQDTDIVVRGGLVVTMDHGALSLSTARSPRVVGSLASEIGSMRPDVS